MSTEQAMSAKMSGEAQRSLALNEVVRPEAINRFRGLVLRGITPDYVRNTLEGAFSGVLGAQHELLSMMEDTWPRLAKNLNELKRSVQSALWHVQPYSLDKGKPTPEAQRRADVVSDAIGGFRPDVLRDLSGWGGLLYDLCDAVGKGLSVQEIMWEVRDAARGGTIIAPVNTRWVPARFYGWPFSEEPGALRLYPEGLGGAGIEFPQHKFLVGLFKARTGLRMETAMLRPLATMWIGASFAYDWALNLAQIFGLPFRWATYDQNLGPKLRDDICDMLENMGSAGWGAFPVGTNLNFVEHKGQAAESPQANLMRIADTACDLLVLGQTLTSDVGNSGSRALGEVHMSVRQDIVEFLTTWVAEALNTQLVPSIIALNFGDLRELPRICGEVARAKDALALAQRDSELAKIGVPVPRNWFYERHEIPPPEAGDDVIMLGGAPTAPAAPGQPGAPGQDPTTADPSEPPQPPEAVKAADATPSATDRLIDNVLERIQPVEAKWLGGVKPFFAGLVEMAKSGNVTDEQLERTLTKAAEIMPELFDQLDVQALEEALYGAMSAGLVNGVSGAVVRRKPKRKGGAR